MSLDTTHVHNVGEFYSQHYLDAVLPEDLGSQLKAWNAREKEGGAKAPHKALARLAEPYFRALAEHRDAADDEARARVCAEFHARVLEALGYPRQPTRRALPDGLELPLSLALDLHGRPYLWVLELPFPLSEDEADPLGERPLDPGPGPDPGPDSDSDAPAPLPPLRELLDGSLLRQDEPPRWVLALAGPDLLLIDRHKWPQGQYLRFGLGEMLGQRKPAALRAVAALVHREVLVPEGGRSLLDQIDEKSHKHAFAVSTDLKYGVQQAIEAIGNEAVHYKREVSKEKIFDRPELAQELARECVTYLYRLLFLFYVEARGGEIGVVPMKAEAYRLGLSVESLRELELVPLTTERARNGTFIHHSLTKLFEVIHLGWPTKRQRDIRAQYADAVDLVVTPQRSPLFDPARTPILSSVKLRNFVLQEVIALLSLSRSKSGRGRASRQRGRISYAQLGINQLGAVYEGLLSYSGFFTQEDTFEVQNPKDKKDESARVFYVPRSAMGDYADDEFRTSESGKKICHPKGSFLYRLAGRDREKSASYYTPEVLTQCLTKYTLKERLGEPGSEGALSADAILELSVCEPAMGSGAFMNEAVNQLAHAYLERKQAERGEQIPAEDYPREWLRVKYHFVSHNCYGVDLNPLAAELGKVSLWLGVLQPGVEAPYLDPRIRVGNSLIGARRAVYEPELLTRKASKKTGVHNWIGTPPTRLEPGHAREAQQVYHFLLPDAAMAAYEKDKVVNKLWPDAIKRLKAWRKQVCTPLTKDEVARLQELSAGIDALWKLHVEQRKSVLERVRQPIAIWGQEPPSGVEARWKTIEEGELISREMERPGSPTRRLRAVMNYWCALWSWPLERVGELPSRGAWMDVVEAMLKGERGECGGDEGFVHWELEFGEVFEGRGGFDVILGNPPWIRLEWREAGVLGDLAPKLVLRKLSAKQFSDARASVFDIEGARDRYLTSFCAMAGQSSYLHASANYPLLSGVKTNLYKCFFVLGWQIGSGTLGFFHQTGILDDPEGGLLRCAFTERARIVVRFENQLKLFSEIGNMRPFCFSITMTQADTTDDTRFLLASNMLHPSTFDESFSHDGVGPVPGVKHESGEWDLRPHASRIVHISDDSLGLFARLYDSADVPRRETRLPALHSQETLPVLRAFANASRRLIDLEGRYHCTIFFDETARQRDGTISRNTGYPKTTSEWIISGPHFHVGNPLNKNPNEGCKTHRDYSPIDLTQIPEGYIPRSNYSPNCPQDKYEQKVPKWNGELVTKRFRHAHREMVAATGERTMIPAVLPPGAGHVHAVSSITFDTEGLMLSFCGGTSSVPIDFFVKSTGMGHVNQALAERLAIPEGQVVPVIHHRTLLLNCLTTHYAPLYNRNLPPTDHLLPSAKSDPRTTGWEASPRAWTWHAPLRTPFARRQALVELDALAALSLGLTLDELQLIYRVQFPVLRQYEAETFYDRRGKIVFTVNRGLSGVGVSRKQWNEIKHAQAGDELPEWAHDAQGPFEPPFDRCEREADMAEAYTYFQRELDL